MRGDLKLGFFSLRISYNFLILVFLIWVWWEYPSPNWVVFLIGGFMLIWNSKITLNIGRIFKTRWVLLRFIKGEKRFLRYDFRGGLTIADESKKSSDPWDFLSAKGLVLLGYKGDNFYAFNKEGELKVYDSFFLWGTIKKEIEIFKYDSKIMKEIEKYEPKTKEELMAILV